MKYIYYSVNATRSRSHLSIVTLKVICIEWCLLRFAFIQISLVKSSANAINKMQGHDHSSIKFDLKDYKIVAFYWSNQTEKLSMWYMLVV